MNDDEIISNAIAIFVDTEGMDPDEIEAIENAVAWAVDQANIRSNMVVSTMTPAYTAWVQRNSTNVRKVLYETIGDWVQNILPLNDNPEFGGDEGDIIVDRIMARFNVSPRAS